MDTTPIETKVSLPALVVGIGWGLIGSLYVLAKAYGFQPSPEQNTAIIGLGAALGYAAQTIVGYLAPHTPRVAAPQSVDESQHNGAEASSTPSKDQMRQAGPGLTPEQTAALTYGNGPSAT